MPYLTKDLLSFYDDAFEAASKESEPYDKIETQLLEYLSKINSGKMVRTLWSTFERKKFLDPNYTSYLLFCYQESVLTELESVIIPDLLSLSKKSWPGDLIFEIQKKSADPERSGTAPTDFEGCGYYGVEHYDISLVRGSQAVHVEFWEFLTERLVGLG